MNISWHRPTGLRLAGWAIVLTASLFAASSPVALSQEPRPSAVRFRVPLDGQVTVAWGGATREVNYHVVAKDQRWAYDLVVVKDGKTSSDQGERVKDYHCYGMPVQAPAEGVVHSTYVDARDMPARTLGGRPAGHLRFVRPD